MRKNGYKKNESKVKSDGKIIHIKLEKSTTRKDNLMKNTALIAIFFLFLITVIGISGCSCGNETYVSKTGTMKHVDLNGWFYGIVSDDGKEYEVINLDPIFQEDNLRVHFDAKIAENANSIHMWGTVVELIDIEKIKGG